MKTNIVIGKIIGAHGIKGEIKVFPITDDPDRFYDINYFICEGTEFKITGARKHKNAVLITAQTINDRNAAEILKGKYIEIRREDAVELQENEFFIEDLKGLKAYDTSSEKIYKLNDVFSTANTDVLEFKNDCETILLAFLDENISEINIEMGYIKADMSKGVKS